MKEIKAFIHRNRIADVIHALKAEGFRNISVIDVKGMIKALDAQEQEYSIELGAKVITEVKLELVCAPDELERAIAVIRANAETGQPDAGWIYVSSLDAAYPIGPPEPDA